MGGIGIDIKDQVVSQCFHGVCFLVLKWPYEEGRFVRKDKVLVSGQTTRFRRILSTFPIMGNSMG